MNSRTESDASAARARSNTGKRFWWGLVAGVLLMIALPLVVLGTGMIDMAATNQPGTVERSLASLALNSSVALRAPDADNPLAGDPAAIETGMSHFRDMCLLCHGAPGIEPYEFAMGLNPDPPELSMVLDEWSDGELFWITHHGIRMTGMPAFGATHSDEDIWRIVAFVRHLPNLTANQKQVLQAASQPGHRHGGQDNGGAGHESKPHDHPEDGQQRGAASDEHHHSDSGHGAS